MTENDIIKLAQGFNARKTLAEVAAETVSYRFDAVGFARAILAATSSNDARDATRYRWLRDSENGGPLSVGKQIDVHDEYPRYEEVDWLYDDLLDAEIDAAMANR